MNQREVADQLRVDAWTVLNWERNKTRPGAKYLGRISTFLGYFPLVSGSSLPERILAARQRMGLTQEALAARLEVAEDSVRNWERGRRRPRGSRLRALQEQLAMAWQLTPCEF